MRFSRIRADAAIVALLVLLTAAVFGQATGFGFTWLDDPVYVSRNREVTGGLTAASVRWALTATSTGNWHPVTWLSHLLDVEAYGLAPGGHHLTSLILHAANAVLLYGVLLGMTGARWRSAIVAALFAVHPLRAESVVWIAERKDVLCAFFFLAGLGAYVGSARKPPPRRNLAVLLCFVLALLAKPMAVTFPLVLLLLDYWPLARTAAAQPAGDGEPGRRAAGLWSGILTEKIPFFAIAIAFGAIAYAVQGRSGAVVPGAVLPLPVRIGNALLSFVVYLRKAIWPSDLAVFYPLSGAGSSFAAFVAAGVFLLVLTALALGQARRRPAIAVGWLWFLLTLLPVIGLVQVGGQAMADRYTYLPLIGATLAAVWSAAGLAAARPSLRLPLGCAAAIVLAALAVAGWSRTRLWRDDLLLYGQAAAAYPGNWVAHTALGTVYGDRGDLTAAEEHFHLALRASQNYLGVYINYAVFLARRGRLAEARVLAERGMAINPVQASSFGLSQFLQTMDRPPRPPQDDPVELRFREGVRLAGLGNVAAAAAEFEAVLAADPRHAAAHNNLGSLAARGGDLPKAISHFRGAIQARSGYAEAHYNLGNALAAVGDLEAAVASFAQALRLKPDAADIANNLGVVQERLGRLDEARASYREALRIAPEHPNAATNLGRLGAP